MDNKKIGKLIASLRNKQGLTQQELGDKVGVGFRAVSKWERGLTLPDITIINELSKILGITSDELLSGKLNDENQTNDKKKSSSFIKILIPVIILVIIVAISIFAIYNNNKTHIYEMKCVNNDEYYIEGQVSFTGDEISIIINKLQFKDDNFASILIKNYEYKVVSNNTFLFGYGYILDGSHIDKEKKINEIANDFRISYTDKTKLKKQDILENNIYLKFQFIDINNKEITKEIEISLLD